MVEMKVTIEDQVDSHIHGDILEVEGVVLWFVTMVESEYS